MAVTIELLEGLAAAAAVILLLSLLIAYTRRNPDGALAGSDVFVVGSVLILIAALSASVGLLMVGLVHAGASVWAALPGSLIVHAVFYSAVSLLTSRRSAKPPSPHSAAA
jgi:hypothetical protein